MNHCTRDCLRLLLISANTVADTRILTQCVIYYHLTSKSRHVLLMQGHGDSPSCNIEFARDFYGCLIEHNKTVVLNAVHHINIEYSFCVEHTYRCLYTRTLPPSSRSISLSSPTSLPTSRRTSTQLTPVPKPTPRRMVARGAHCCERVRG